MVKELLVDHVALMVNVQVVVKVTHVVVAHQIFVAPLEVVSHAILTTAVANAVHVLPARSKKVKV